MPCGDVMKVDSREGLLERGLQIAREWKVYSCREDQEVSPLIQTVTPRHILPLRQILSEEINAGPVRSDLNVPRDPPTFIIEFIL